MSVISLCDSRKASKYWQAIRGGTFSLVSKDRAIKEPGVEEKLFMPERMSHLVMLTMGQTLLLGIQIEDSYSPVTSDISTRMATFILPDAKSDF